MHAPGIVVAAVWWLLIAANIFIILRAVWSNRSVWRGWATRLAGAVRRRCSRRRRGAEEWPEAPDPLAARVLQELDQRRVGRARTAVMYFSAIQLTLAVIRLTLARGPEDEKLTTARQDSLYFLRYVLLTFLACFPQCITRRTLDVLYSLCMLITVLIVSPVASDMMNVAKIYWGIVITSFGLSLFDLRILLNTFWTCALALMASYTIVSSEEDGIPGFAKQTLATHVAAFTALSIFASAFTERCITESVRQEVRATASQEELNAVQAILGAICDVVVELDGSLRLARHAPKLADLLFLNPMQSLQGQELQSFMPLEADRQDFARRIGVPSGSGHCSANVFHCAMRDSGGASVSMELFGVAFHGPDHKPRHLLGMREFTDVPPVVRARRGAGAPEGQEPPQGAPEARLPDVQSSTERSSSASCSGCSEEFAPQPSMETSAKAKAYTLTYTLMGWSLPPCAGECCSWHAALREAHQVVARMRSAPCALSFPPRRTWQCRSCGILDEDFRDKRRSSSGRCKLCRNFPEAQQGRSAPRPESPTTLPSGGLQLRAL